MRNLQDMERERRNLVYKKASVGLTTDEVIELQNLQEDILVAKIRKSQRPENI